MLQLAKIQQELVAPKNLHNKFGGYNYRSCEGILEAVKPLLAKYNCTLTLTDSTEEIAGIPVVNACATIRNADGEQVQVTAQAGVDVNRKGMDISQSFGASGSYARKYALNGLFLIDDTKDADATNKHGKDEPKVDTKQLKTRIAAKLKTCKTVAQVEDEYKVEKEYINQLVAIDKEEIVQLFADKKNELKGDE